ncbi:MAG: hypothetical protein FWF51_05790 [Chitinivibrionia bacterium]|nr:hypothetical protein [Chitinivibrionia bacterium]
MGKDVEFIANYNGGDGFTYVAFNSVTAGFTAPNVTFNRQQQCNSAYNSHTATVSTNADYVCAHEVKLPYTISTTPATGNITIGNASANTDVRVVNDTLRFNPGKTANIPISVLRNNEFKNGTFNISFENFVYATNCRFDPTTPHYTFTKPANQTVTIATTGQQQVALSAPIFSPVSPTGIYEFRREIPTSQQTTTGTQPTYPKNQTLVTVSATGGAGNPANGYELQSGTPSVPNDSINKYFMVENGVIKARDIYESATNSTVFDYETRTSITLKVRAIASGGLSCSGFNEGPWGEVTIPLRPWNDVNSLGSVNPTIPQQNTNVGENLQFSDVQLLAFAGIVGTAINGSTSGQDVGGTNVYKIVNVSGASRTGSNTTFNDVATSGDRSFTFTVRDTATYSYNTAYFDKVFTVNVKVNPVATISPSAEVPLTLCENTSKTISIVGNQIRDGNNVLGTITDNDWTNQNLTQSLIKYTIDSTVTTGKNISGASATVSGGNLLYNLSGVAPSVETFTDVITFGLAKQYDNGSIIKGTAKINVNILPVNDNAPVAKDTIVNDAMRGTTVQISITPNLITDADRTTNNSYRDGYEVLNVFQNVPSGFTVTANGNVVSVNIPQIFSAEYVEIKYAVKDVVSYTNICTNTSKDSEYKTIRLNLINNDKDVVRPLPDTIFVKQKDRLGVGGSVSVLWNGYDNVLWNDTNHYLTVNNTGTSAGTVILRDSTKYGEIDLKPNGTFTYTHNNEDFLPEDYPFKDSFKYAVRASSGNNIISDDFNTTWVGEVTIFINQVNKESPILVAKKDYLNAFARKEIKAIVLNPDRSGIGDWDPDPRTEFVIDRDGHGTDDYYKVINSPDPSLFSSGALGLQIHTNTTFMLQYNADFGANSSEDSIKIEIEYYVRDKLNVQWHQSVNNNNGNTMGPNYTTSNNGSPLWSTKVNNFADIGEKTLCTLEVTLYPKPRAVNYDMLVEEMDGNKAGSGKNDTLITNYNEEKKTTQKYKYYLSLQDTVYRMFGDIRIVGFKFGDPDDSNKPMNEMSLKLTNGTIVFKDLDNGIVEYTHEEGKATGDSVDLFVYYMFYDIGDGTVDTTKGEVVVNVKQREPRQSQTPARYEDINGNGRVDKVTIYFDRKIEINATDFDVKFAGKDFGIDGTYNKAFYPKDDDEKDIDSTVVLTLLEDNYGAPKDVTSGTMEITVTHNDYVFGIAVPTVRDTIVNVEDRAAVVFKDTTAIFVESLSQKDSLIFVLTEKASILTRSNHPFRFTNGAKFIEDGELVEITFDGDPQRYGSESSDSLFVVINERHKGKLDEGDSVFINVEAAFKVKDNNEFATEQIIPENKRVKLIKRIVQDMDAVTAVYVDLGTKNDKGGFDEIYDGFIDLIKVDIGMEITKAAAETFASNLSLSETRFGKDAETQQSNIDSVSVNGSVINLYVKEVPIANQKMSNRTGLIDDDTIKLTQTTQLSNIFTVNAGQIAPKDEVAPVIVKGIYSPKDSTLEVIFSEKVNLATAKGIVDPYKFRKKSPDDTTNYTMPLVSTNNPTAKAGSDSILVYSGIDPKNIKGTVYPLNGDSLQIVASGVISDGENVQDKSVFAPLELSSSYDKNVEVLIVPQPLVLMSDGPKGLDPNLLNYYGIKGDDMKRGVAVIVEAKGPISKIEGSMKVIDQTGNAVIENINFTPVTVGEGRLVAYAIWNGKNTAGRTVGASTYLALVEGNVVFDEGGGKGNTESIKERKIIVVKQGGKAKDE